MMIRDQRLKSIKKVVSVSSMIFLSISMNPMSWVYAAQVDRAIQFVRNQTLDQIWANSDQMNLIAIR